MNIPEDLRYTDDHEWVRSESSAVRVGITDFAQDALGDVVFVALPEVGAQVNRGAVLGEVESTKSVSEIYSPLSGVIAEVNLDLKDSPEHINSGPYGDGWFCVITPADDTELDQLLSAEDYRKLIEA